LSKRLFILILISCLLAFLTSGCSLIASKNSTPPAVETSQTTPAREFDPVQEVDEAITAADTKQARQQIIEIGTSKFTAPITSNNKDKTITGAREITLNFQGTDIHEFIKATLGDVLKLNYIIDPQVAGTVTMETAEPVSKAELFPMLEEILSMNGAVIVKDGSYYHIVPKANAIKGNVSPTLATNESAGGYTVRIIPLSYIAAGEMQKILEPFLPEGGSIQVDNKRNLLVLGGTPHEIDRLQETITIFDVDWLRGMSMGLYPLDYVEPKVLKTELDAILADKESDKDGTLLSGLVRTVAIERLHSILLISSTPAALRETEIWIHRLDRPGEQTGQNLYVYNVQNAKATDIADILGLIFGKRDSKMIQSAPSMAPGTTPVDISSIEPGENVQNEISTVRPVSAGADVTLPSSDSIEIIADDVRNALVVLATPNDYKMVKATIEKLDVVPLQVLIEASIIEVTLTDELNYGVEWFFKNTIDGKIGRGTLDLDADIPGIAAIAPGFSYTIIDNIGNVRLALNALAAESEINVLSSPSLMVLDNQTARINVGDEIPIPTRQSISNVDPSAPTVNEIQFRKTGVTLTVTPRVNNSGLVIMEIKQEVSNAVTTTTSSLDAPTIQLREIESVVAINSGETIVLGGLIQDSQTNNESGIPGLYKIPFIGKLFGQTTDDLRRTELLVLITPRVVRSRVEARGITEEFRRKLKGIPPLEIQTGQSTADNPS
jgi:general secretion pathway protein D